MYLNNGPQLLCMVQAVAYSYSYKKSLEAYIVKIYICKRLMTNDLSLLLHYDYASFDQNHA